MVVLQREPLHAASTWRDHGIPDVWQEKVSKSHPQSKPIGLQERLIRAVTQPGELVVDPAAGGYSVLEVCMRCERNFCGSDNTCVQLVNFWPDIELDEYIQLEGRVKGRRALRTPRPRHGPPRDGRVARGRLTSPERAITHAHSPSSREPAPRAFCRCELPGGDESSRLQSASRDFGEMPDSRRGG